MEIVCQVYAHCPPHMFQFAHMCVCVCCCCSNPPVPYARDYALQHETLFPPSTNWTDSVDANEPPTKRCWNNNQLRWRDAEANTILFHQLNSNTLLHHLCAGVASAAASVFAIAALQSFRFFMFILWAMCVCSVVESICLIHSSAAVAATLPFIRIN